MFLLFQQEKCKCQKSNCETKSCQCRKNGRLCRRSAFGCGTGCENLGDEEADDDGDESGEKEVGTSAAMESGSPSAHDGVKLQCAEVPYDPRQHNATWHNDKPFALEVYTRRHKKCRGCGSTFARPKEADPKFVISHEEHRELWTKHGHGKMGSQSVFYHCSASCISPLHPYFKPRELAGKSPVKRTISGKDAEYIERCRITLPFRRRV